MTPVEAWKTSARLALELLCCRGCHGLNRGNACLAGKGIGIAGIAQ